MNAVDIFKSIKIKSYIILVLKLISEWRIRLEFSKKDIKISYNKTIERKDL